jgi:hypothetical protein
MRWHRRVLDFGHGKKQPLDASEAIKRAAAADGHAPCAVEPGLGFDLGQRVTVAATDYGIDPVSGVLVGLTDEEVVLERHNPRAGRLHVHFPRIGFQLKAEKK